MKTFYQWRHGALAVAMLVPGLLDGCATAASERAAPAHYAVIDRVPSAGEGGWDFVTFDPADRRLFIARSDRVQVWSADSKQVVAEIADTEGVHGVALAAGLGRGFTSNGRSNTVSVFALQDLHVIQKIAIPGVNPDAILYEPTARRVYVFNGRSNDATVIDAVTLRLLATIALGGKPEVAVSDGKGHVFVNIENTSELVVIDQATNTVQARWPLAPCEEPTGLAIDIAHARLFSVCANHTMAIVDAGSGRVVGQVPIGGEPDGAEFDAALGLAISSNGEGSLTLVREIDPEHFAVASTVETQARARTLSLDPISHRIYLVSAAFGPPAAATPQQPRPRPPMLPHSFAVLVVAPK